MQGNLTVLLNTGMLSLSSIELTVDNKSMYR